jgi:hypothetical protein
MPELAVYKDPQRKEQRRAELNNWVNLWRSRGTTVVTLSSNDDWLVPPDDALIPEANIPGLQSPLQGLGWSIKDPFDPLGHGQVLQHPKALAAIQKTLSEQISPVTPPPTDKDQSIIVGKTTQSEIEQAPGIKAITELPDTKKQYSFASVRVDRDNIVITQNGIVVFSRTLTELRDHKLPNLNEFKTVYGEPEKEIEGSRYYGRIHKTYIYASRGIAIIANPYSNEIYELHNYGPMSVDQYVQTWGEDIKSYKDEPTGI